MSAPPPTPSASPLRPPAGQPPAQLGAPARRPLPTFQAPAGATGPGGAPQPEPPAPPPVQVNVAQAPSSRLDPVEMIELAYRYGVAVVFACVLLGALLYYANRLDERSNENARVLALMGQHVDDIETAQDRIQADVTRLAARLGGPGG